MILIKSDAEHSPTTGLRFTSIRCDGRGGFLEFEGALGHHAEAGRLENPEGGPDQGSGHRKQVENCQNNGSRRVPCGELIKTETTDGRIGEKTLFELAYLYVVRTIVIVTIW